jgi:hypothetical protein
MPITRRPKLSWPGGARVALWVNPNIEFFGLDDVMPSNLNADEGRPCLFRDEGVGSRIRGNAAAPVRHALPGGRDYFPGHGDRGSPVRDRPAAPDRRLDAELDYICSHAGVWRARGWEIVQHVRARQLQTGR